MKTAVQPHNIEAERSVLGAILINSGCFDRVYGKIQAEDFYGPGHAAIFSAMCRMLEDKSAIDLVTLCEHISQTGTLEQCGGAVYLSSLLEGTPTSVNIEYHAKIVSQRAMLRRLLTLMEKTYREGMSDTAPPIPLIEKLEIELLKLRGAGTVGNIVSAQSAITAELERFNALLSGTAKSTAIPSGYYRLDEIIGGLEPGRLIIIAARPSRGKSALAYNIMLNLCLRQIEAPGCDPFPIPGIVSLESDTATIIRRMFAAVSNINTIKIRNPILRSGVRGVGQAEVTAITDAARKLYETKYYISKPGRSTIAKLVSTSRLMVKDKHVNVMIWDYAQLVAAASSKQSVVDKLTDLTHEAKLFAEEYAVPVILLSQLNRDAEKVKGKSTMSNAKGSGSFEEDADVLIEVKWDCDEAEEISMPDSQAVVPITIRVSKNRDGPRGDLKGFELVRSTTLIRDTREFQF